MICLSKFEVEKLLDYDPVNGLFSWKKNMPGGIAKCGSVAGRVNTGGYIQISIFGKKVRAHRLAFIFMTGREPIGLVDHINRVRSDNSWENLRECTVSENAQNLKPRESSLPRGVTKHKKSGAYQAQICLHGKRTYLGSFANPESAASAYSAAKSALHPFAGAV